MLSRCASMAIIACLPNERAALPATLSSTGVLSRSRQAEPMIGHCHPSDFTRSMNLRTSASRKIPVIRSMCRARSSGEGPAATAGRGTRRPINRRMPSRAVIALCREDSCLQHLGERDSRACVESRSSPSLRSPSLPTDLYPYLGRLDTGHVLFALGSLGCARRAPMATPMAMSCTRCSPRQRTVAPGGPSPLRPKWPPS